MDIKVRISFNKKEDALELIAFLSENGLPADSKIDSTDASKILEYYAAVSTGQIPNWNEM